MAQANPGQSLNGATAAGAGTAIDFMGATFVAPTVIAMHVTCATFTASYDASSVAGLAVAMVGLEVSMDNSNWVRVGVVPVRAVTSGVARGITVSSPARYARATLDALDSRISSIAVSAWVAGGT